MTITNDNKITIVLSNGLNGLGVMRSLDKAGFKSIAILNSKDGLVANSKLPNKKIFLPNNHQWEEEVSNILDSLIFDFKPPIIACSDRAAAFLANNRQKLSEKYSLLIPSLQITEILNDKKLEIEHINALDVPIPNSLSNIVESIENEKITQLNYPIIIKPRLYSGYQLIKAKNIIINNDDEWRDFYITHKNNLEHLVAQEIITGKDEKLWVCNATFNKQSEMISAFTFQRLGTMPSHYGVTSLAISKENKTIKEYCKKIGESLSYTGPAMFEFKFDETSNKYIYIETNPRLGMCNWFDSSCGINNVEMTCLEALDLPLPKINKQKNDYVWCDFLGDFIARMENSEGIKNILKTYSPYFFSKKVWAVYLFKDPLPSIMSFKSQVLEIIKRVFKKLFKRGKYSTN